MLPPHRMTRRAALKLGASGTLGFLWGCAAQTTFAAPPAATTTRRFTPVNVSSDRIIRRVVGLRPYRPDGFLLQAAQLGDKLLVHDYGHGGGGISLSWGTAHLAVEQAEANLDGRPRRAAVLGCGVVGLSTTRLLQRKGWEVTIYARDLPPLTTSNVAGGQWTPTSVHEPGQASPAFVEQYARASRLAYREFQNFVGNEYGVSWIDNYHLSDSPPRARGLDTLLPEVFANQEVFEQPDHPFPARYARRVTTMLIEPAIYLNALLRDARIAGAKVIVRDFADRNQIEALPEPVIMNCTGLGAGKLFGDETLTPVKGQLTILQPQPEVDYIVLHSGLYMFPRKDGILLGGTYERGNASLEFDEAAEQRIVAGHQRMFAAMRS